MIERRRHLRVPFTVQVNCGGEMNAHPKDLSEGGLRLVGDTDLPVGKIVDLRFTLPGTGDLIHAYGKVIWSRRSDVQQYETGLSFWEIGDVPKARLLEFLRTGRMSRD